MISRFDYFFTPSPSLWMCREISIYCRRRKLKQWVMVPKPGLAAIPNHWGCSSTSMGPPGRNTTSQIQSLPAGFSTKLQPSSWHTKERTRETEPRFSPHQLPSFISALFSPGLRRGTQQLPPTQAVRTRPELTPSSLLNFEIPPAAGKCWRAEKAKPRSQD